MKTFKNLQVKPGLPQPEGAVLLPDGINFALFSRHAEKVSLVIDILPDSLRGKKKRREFFLEPLTNKTGDIWHVCIQGLPENFTYGYRLGGPYDPRGKGHHFNDQLILIDPCAKALSSSVWGGKRNTLGTSPCCRMADSSYDWEGDRRPGIPLRDTIIYEMHVRGFTRHPSSGVKHPGTYTGVIEKIPYLKELGITAVELMPVMEFNENETLFHNPLTGKKLKNYWGYSPLSFFAPKAGYCVAHDNQVNEFRDMVKALHRAGIEVILDVVFNHTAEGGMDGPTTSFRGIDNTIYYMLDPATRDYLNFSGCGNTFNCNHPVARNLIMKSLRWWVVEMHVDGFRFDLASILGRDQSGNVLSNPPVVELIAEDPVLAGAKIIAEAWDAAGLYQVGSFSSHKRWAEWNGRFRDDVRSFMCGHPGSVSALATRIAGSSDLYNNGEKLPHNSINFITSHDGFTLQDLVSYNDKHNLENGEENRDGDNHNISWNSGVEGGTADKSILRLRARRIRTMAVILFLSQGVPMLLAGDEFGRSQKGNNNAWCQDNEISWVNWELLARNRGQFAFFRRLIQLRHEHPVFRRKVFFMAFHPENDPLHLHEIIWQGLRPGEQDWSDECRTLGLTLNGSVLEEEDDDFFIMLNAHRDEKKKFIVPAPPRQHRTRIWKMIMNTYDEPSMDAGPPKKGAAITAETEITVQPMSCIVLQSWEQ
ncbi:MAG: glycogen debranching protein GlgX [Desulfobulbaceae bacterium]|nr:glycogen debranching protein GlgX [Desulfobulbaceae bacterium]